MRPCRKGQIALTEREHDFFMALGNLFLARRETDRRLEMLCAQDHIDEQRRLVRAVVLAPAWQLRAPIRIVALAIVRYMRSIQLPRSYQSYVADLLNRNRGCARLADKLFWDLETIIPALAADLELRSILREGAQRVSDRYFDFIGLSASPFRLGDSILDHGKWQIPFRLTREGIACDRRARRAYLAERPFRGVRDIIAWLHLL